jgi:hypothetical protein
MIVLIHIVPIASVLVASLAWERSLTEAADCSHCTVCTYSPGEYVMQYALSILYNTMQPAQYLRQSSRTGRSRAIVRRVCAAQLLSGWRHRRLGGMQCTNSSVI